MEPRYRPYMTQPNEALLLSTSPLATTARFAQFLDESLLPMERVVASTMCAAPIPLYVDATATANGRQFPEGTNPHIFWHPLFWLPASLSSHLSYKDTDGTTKIETDDEWAARVALTLGSSGIYDIENGAWLDVLSLVDLDIEDELTIDRINDWLSGDPDPDLDRIDLSTFTDIPDQPYWAFRTVKTIYDQLELASYALLTGGTLETIDIIVEENTDTQEMTGQFANAVEALGATLPDIGFDFDGRDFNELTTEIVEAAREHDGDWNSFVLGTVAYYRAALIAVRDAFLPALEQLQSSNATASAPSSAAE